MGLLAAHNPGNTAMSRIFLAAAALFALSAAGQETGETEVRSEYRPNVLDTEGALDMVESVEKFGEALAPPAPEAAATGALRITVRDAVEKALAANPRIDVSEADVAAAKARIGQIKAQRLPQVSGRLGHTWNDRIDPIYNFRREEALSLLGPLTGFVGGVGGGGAVVNPNSAAGLFTSIAYTRIQRDFIEDLQPEPTTTAVQLNINQVVYAGGRIAAAIAAADALAQSEAWRRAAAYDDIEFQTKRAYYDCLAAQAFVRVAAESVKSFERNLADARQMFEAGTISNFEVLRSQTELGAREADAIAASNAERLAQANLRRLMALPQSTPLELEARLDWLPYVAPLEELVVQAAEYRPEIRGLEEAIDAANHDLRRVKAAYKPNVAASAEYQNIDGAPSQPDGWLFTLGAEWEIAAGGRRRAERIETNARIDSLEAQLADLTQLIELDVVQARILIEDSIAKTQRERGNVELAREGLRLAEMRFLEGVGIQSETLDAELALTTAETNLVQALRDFAVANAALERATGKSWYRDPEATTLRDE